MLSSIGRAAVRRLAARPVYTSCHNVLASSKAACVPIDNHLRFAWSRSSSGRFFATAGRPKGSTTKKSATKARASKKTAKKPVKKPVKKPKKVLTPEAQALQEKKKLKAKSLYNGEPETLPQNPWMLYVAQTRKGATVPQGQLGSVMADLSQSFKSLSASELEHLTSLAEENKRKNSAALKEWVESHTAEEILEANNARKLLKKKFNFPKSRTAKTIPDERQPKRQQSAFALFTKARWATGEFSNAKIAEVAQKLTGEWKQLSEAEKQPYVDLAKADRERYMKEVFAAYGRELKE